jgi:hypothetical protein
MPESGNISGQATAARRIRAAALAAAVLAGALGVSLVRDCGSGWLAREEAATPADARAWLEAVRAGHEREAELLAVRLVPKVRPRLPDPDYLEWFASFGMGSRFLTEPFDGAGFRRWRDALLAEEILVRAAPPTPESVLAAILAQVKVTKDVPVPGPADNQAAWAARVGNPWDLLRLYALALTTAGCQVQVVAVHNAEGGIIHQLCEVRSGDRVWVADPARGQCREGRDVAGWLASGEAGPLPSGLREQARFISFHLPAEPVDYRPGQQRLAEALSALLGKDAPRFGDDPRARIEAWRRHAPPPAQSHFTYWRYPVETLLADPAVPPAWRHRP